MDPLLFVRYASPIQSRELERAETLRCWQPSASSRLWATGGDRVHRQKLAPFELRLRICDGFRTDVVPRTNPLQLGCYGESYKYAPEMETITGIEIPVRNWILRFCCGFPKFRSRNRRLCFSPRVPPTHYSNRASNPVLLTRANEAREYSRSTQDPPAHVVGDRKQCGGERAAQPRHAASGKDRFGLTPGLRSRIRQSVGCIGSSRYDLLADWRPGPPQPR